MYDPDNQEIYVKHFKRPVLPFFRDYRADAQLHQFDKDIEVYKKTIKIYNERLKILEDERRKCLRYMLRMVK